MLVNRGSAFGITTGYGLDDRGAGLRVPVGSRILSSPHRPDRLWGSPTQGVPGTISPEVKLPGREADHSLPASAEVKQMWTYTSTPPYTIMA
jgi:hypothetical protein